jgi:hypothetical protein
MSLNYYLCDICTSALSKHYNLVCQCAHRCRLHKQSVSFYCSGRGRVIAYEPSGKVIGGASTLTLVGLCFAPPSSQIHSAFPTRRSGLHVTPAISCSNHVREKKKSRLMRIALTLSLEDGTPANSASITPVFYSFSMF